MVVFDSGAVSHLAARPMAERRAWWAADPVVPSMVLVECLTGHGPRDALVNAFLKRCTIVEYVSQRVARRAAQLRTQAGQGSAVDALIVALAEPGGTVVTADVRDINALAAYALHVSVERVSNRPVR